MQPLSNTCTKFVQAAYNSVVIGKLLVLDVVVATVHPPQLPQSFIQLRNVMVCVLHTFSYNIVAVLVTCTCISNTVPIKFTPILICMAFAMVWQWLPSFLLS